MSKATIHWLGTGGGLNVTLGNTSFLLEADGARPLLVDCGFTVPQRLLQLDRLAEIDHVLITHLHADHIGGLETFGFFRRFVCGDVGDRRPILHMPTDGLAHDVWEHSLRGGMGQTINKDGDPIPATLESYFQVRVSTEVHLEGLPKVSLFETPHVHGAENFGMWIGDRIYYSGDTIDLPPEHPELIFHDCQFGHTHRGDVHIGYNRLRDELPPEVKAKMHLVHLGQGYGDYDAKKDGFAGFVEPGAMFQI